VATVFTTEATMPLGRAVLDVIDAHVLTQPTRNVSWDPEAEAFIVADVIEGDALDAYFGVPAAPFEHNPGSWSEGNRVDAAHFLEDGQDRYAGGTLHAGIGRVINGSFMAPALGFVAEGGAPKNVPFQWDASDAPTWSLEAMIPFTLFLCDEHLGDPANLPVAIFTHGGTGHRSSGLAWANLNCQLGVATIAYDNIFHGGRIQLALNSDETVILPTRLDAFNAYTGLTLEDEGFVPDQAGDNGGGPETVGQLYALPAGLDPGIAEGNLLTMMSDTHALVRLVKEGDWGQIQEGLSFDDTKIFHQGLSYGSSFTTPLLALTRDFVGEVWSVGSGAMVAANLCTAPENAELATGFMRFTLGLAPLGEELLAAVWLDPIVGMIQWLTQRGDPMGYAPYVLRHREDDYTLPIIATGNSWDETLGAAAQLSFGQALGLPVYTHGEDWTLDPTQPAVDTVVATAYQGTPLVGNVTFGDRTHSAALFYSRQTCHAMQIRPVCSATYQKPYPPIVELEEPLVEASPICAIQTATKAFMASLLGGATHPEIAAPEGTCEALYVP
ncbi:MAG: hypothetical protein QF464_04030, partial [Myxococcota bacterium]|nr:hypothetical protein [Myxococcota bacterium]